MRRTLAVAVLALWALIGLPGTAHAGGPTSVLITEPQTGKSAALYYTSQEYVDLERALTEAPSDSTAGRPAGSGGTDYNLTWMIHDVQPWRLDSVHITADGSTAYVATTMVTDPDAIAPEPDWREVAQPEQLAAILDHVLPGGRSTAAPQPVIEQQPATDQAPAAAPAEPTTRWFSLSGWRWVVPGVLGGLLVGLVATRRRVPGEARRSLVDLPPERAGV